MNLSDYLESKKITQAELGDAIRIDDGIGVTQGAVHQWIKYRVPAERLSQLVRISKGAMTYADLRPDLFGVNDKKPPIRIRKKKRKSSDNSSVKKGKAA